MISHPEKGNSGVGLLGAVWRMRQQHAEISHRQAMSQHGLKTDITSWRFLPRT